MLLKEDSSQPWMIVFKEHLLKLGNATRDVLLWRLSTDQIEALCKVRYQIFLKHYSEDVHCIFISLFSKFMYFTFLHEQDKGYINSSWWSMLLGLKAASMHMSVTRYTTVLWALTLHNSNTDTPDRGFVFSFNLLYFQFVIGPSIKHWLVKMNNGFWQNVIQRGQFTTMTVCWQEQSIWDT